MLTVFLGIVGTLGLLLSILFTRRAVAAAVSSNENAQEALRHAKEMAAVELRPYLHVEEITVDPATRSLGRTMIAITVKNFGATPAISFRIEAGVQSRNTGKKDVASNIPIRRHPSVDEIPPGHSVTIRIPGYPQGHFFNPSVALLCTVKFHYSDRFGADHMRWETYKADDIIRDDGKFYFLTKNPI